MQLFVVAAFACLGGFLFGYDLGLIGGALLPMQEQLGFGDGGAQAVVGAAKLGAVAGTFTGGALMLCYGRKKAMAFNSIFFLAGPAIMAASVNMLGLVVGRAIIGFGIGISAVVVPAYLGEVAPAAVRGRLVEVYEFLLCFGMLAAVMVDAALQGVAGGWRWMVGAPMVPAAIFACALWLLPESPRWLVVNGRLDEALAVIHRIFTSQALPVGVQVSTAEVEQELLDLWSSVEKDRHAVQERRRQHSQLRQQRKASAAAGGSQQAKGSWLPLHQQPEFGADGSSLTGAEERAGKGLAAAGEEESQLLLHQQPQAGTQGGALAGQTSTTSAHEATGVTQHATDIGALPGTQHGVTEMHDVPNIPANGSREPGLANGHADGAGQAQLHERPAVDSPRRNGTPAAAVLWSADVAHEGGSLHAMAASAGAASATTDPAALQATPTHGAAAAGTAPAPAGFWATLCELLGDVAQVAQGQERRAFWLALWLAFWNQAFASTAIINYAPEVLEHAGVESHRQSTLYTSAVGASKLAGVALSFLLVDSLGRRPLLIWGSAGCSLALGGLVAADWFDAHAAVVCGMCAFIFAFSASWAGIFWVLLSEIFSMGAKSAAASAATAMLFATGAAADLLFLSIHAWLGPFAFLLYSLVAAAAGIHVALAVPETKGRTLQEVQALLAAGVGPQLDSMRSNGTGSAADMELPGWQQQQQQQQDSERVGLVTLGSLEPSVELGEEHRLPRRGFGRHSGGGWGGWLPWRAGG